MHYFTLSIVILSLILILYTVIKLPSINYFTVIFIIYGLMIRPYVVLLNGGTLITEDYFDMGDYEFGYFLASMFMLIYSIGLKMGLAELTGLKNSFSKYQIYIDNKLKNILFALTIVLCLIFLFIGGADILFINRETTISMQKPLLRYLFPFVTVLLCATTIHTILEIFYKNYFLGITKIFVLFLITSILAQRGFFIVFTIIALSLIILYDKKQIYKFKSLTIISLIIITIFLKDLMFSLFKKDIISLQSESIIEKILLRPDGDVTEVWMLTIQYLKNHDFSYGVSIINNIFNLLSHNLRHSWGLDNGQDILNGFFGGSRYWEYGFGFNVTLPIEAYLNFSYLGILLVFFAGFIMGRAITYNYKSIFIYGQDPALCSLRLYAVWTITSSFAGLQWAVIYYLIYKIIKFLGYGIPRKSQFHNPITANIKS